MLTAVPRRWFAWDFALTDGDQPLADIDISWWREKGDLTISGAPYRVYREVPLAGAFILENHSGVVARAIKPSAFTRRLIIEHGSRRHELRPSFALSRRFQLFSGDVLVGSLSPTGFLSRRMEINLPETLPLPVRTFIVWLTLMLWKRDSEASG